jgi:hypothetical protein
MHRRERTADSDSNCKCFIVIQESVSQNPKAGRGKQVPFTAGVKNLQGWGEIPSIGVLSHTESISRKPDLNKVIFNC